MAKKKKNNNNQYFIDRANRLQKELSAARQAHEQLQSAILKSGTLQDRVERWGDLCISIQKDLDFGPLGFVVDDLLDIVERCFRDAKAKKPKTKKKVSKKASKGSSGTPSGS